MTEHYDQTILDARTSGPVDARLELYDTLPPLPNDLIENIARPSDKIILTGGSKSFKSWVMIDLAVSMITGGKWMGIFQCERRPALYIDPELRPESFQNRLQKIVDAKHIKDFDYGLLGRWSIRGKNKPVEHLVSEVIEFASMQKYRDNGPYGLIVFDSIYKLYAGRNENSASEMGNLLMQIEHMACASGAAVIYSHHQTKGSSADKHVLDRSSGSGVFSRDADAIIDFTDHEEDEAYILECVLRDHPPLEKTTMVWSFPLMIESPQLDPDRPRIIRPRSSRALPPVTVHDVLKHIGKAPQTRGEIESKVQQSTGRGVGAVRQAFSRVIDEGLANVITGDNNAKKYNKP